MSPKISIAFWLLVLLPATLEHEEIKDLMPAMQMEFWIRNPALMNGVRVGDKVESVVVEDRKGQYLTELKRAPGR
jgi:Cu/Ag efflux protein CusF